MLRIAVLISGGGTTLKNLIEAQSSPGANFEIALVIASSPSAGGIEFAKQASIPFQVVVAEKSDAHSVNFSHAIFSAIEDSQIELVVMGGFLKLLPIPDHFADRVINIHPSLIPAFCGQGFYGLKVHQSVLDFGCKLTGCTVHFVDNQFDHGPIIAQRAVPVKSGDSAESLQQRVFAAECELYPQVITAFANQQIQRDGRWVALNVPAQSE